MHTAVDVYGFAGGFTLGMVQAGFKLLGKREGEGGFGVPICEDNRHLLGDDWRSESTEPRRWSPVKDVRVIFGNPPCSGFSTFSPASFRGVDSPVNACMWDLVHYATRCGTPDVIAFESVQPAFTLGRPLMQELRNYVERATGLKYQLYHILHNAASVGGPSIRKRYFFLLSRVPFGIDFPYIKAVPSLYETICDLRGLHITMAEQPYVNPPSWYSEHLRRSDGLVDGHMIAYSNSVRRILDILKEVPWYVNETLIQACKRYYEKNGQLPESFIPGSAERFEEVGWHMGFQPKRWDYTRPAKVVMGSGPHAIIHPEEARTMTFREVARVMGFPDSWRVGSALRHRSGPSWFGKGITVHCGAWIGHWIHRALDENPGSFSGTTIGDRESFIDITNTYKFFPGAHIRNGRIL